MLWLSGTSSTTASTTRPCERGGDGGIGDRPAGHGQGHDRDAGDARGVDDRVDAFTADDVVVSRLQSHRALLDPIPAPTDAHAEGPTRGHAHPGGWTSGRPARSGHMLSCPTPPGTRSAPTYSAGRRQVPPGRASGGCGAVPLRLRSGRGQGSPGGGGAVPGGVAGDADGAGGPAGRAGPFPAAPPRRVRQAAGCPQLGQPMCSTSWWGSRTGTRMPASLPAPDTLRRRHARCRDSSTPGYDSDNRYGSAGPGKAACDGDLLACLHRLAR